MKDWVKNAPREEERNLWISSLLHFLPPFLEDIPNHKAKALTRIVRKGGGGGGIDPTADTSINVRSWGIIVIFGGKN